MKAAGMIRHAGGCAVPGDALQALPRDVSRQ